MKKNTVALIAVTVTSLYPVLFLYFNNIDEVPFHELYLPATLFLAIGAGFALIFGILLKSLLKGSVASIFFVLLFSNYALIEKAVHFLFPQIKYWHLVPISVILLLHAIYFLCIKGNEEANKWIALFITLFMGGLIAFNFTTAIPTMIEKSPTTCDRLNEEPKSKVQTNQNLPNVYYLIYDEYSNFGVIEKYFSYDNSDFAQFLEDKGFEISYNSHNESDFTTTVITNYVNMAYIVNDNMSATEKKTIRNGGDFFEIMMHNGYRIKAVGDAGFFGLKSEIGDQASEGATIGGESFFDLLINNTLYYPFHQKSSYFRAIYISDTFSYFEDKNNYQQGLILTMCYVTFPHQPFIFDENGKEVNNENFNNWDDKRYYLGQYIYATKLVRQQIESIMTYDPNSVIILQSDHSARLLRDSNKKRIIIEEDRRNPLNAVYYKGEAIEEIDGQSGVNTIRLVVNRLFNKNLPLLEVPYNAENLSDID